ncbi:hypothetical protein V8G54_019504 [Vigna mungo]|uniref:Uncharacterized protein n=1 Tax=Vigna mungo TaxID=3915 RepID=A0AAQ3NDA2_VIGMU
MESLMMILEASNIFYVVGRLWRGNLDAAGLGRFGDSHHTLGSNTLDRFWRALPLGIWLVTAIIFYRVLQRLKKEAAKKGTNIQKEAQANSHHSGFCVRFPEEEKKVVLGFLCRMKE